jgi:phosphonate transport system permease protein
MLGRLFAETIENIDLSPVEALAPTGANRLQVFTHAVVPSILPALFGISLYRLDENIRSSLVLGFVGAGGLGFQILTAMNLFQYREVSLLLILVFFIVFVTEQASAICRERLA